MLQDAYAIRLAMNFGGEWVGKEGEELPEAFPPSMAIFLNSLVPIPKQADVNWDPNGLCLKNTPRITTLCTMLANADAWLKDAVGIHKNCTDYNCENLGI